MAFFLLTFLSSGATLLDAVQHHIPTQSNPILPYQAANPGSGRFFLFATLLTTQLIANAAAERAPFACP